MGKTEYPASDSMRCFRRGMITAITSRRLYNLLNEGDYKSYNQLMLPKSLTKLMFFVCLFVFHSKVQYHSEIKCHVVSADREVDLINIVSSAIISGQSRKLSETDTFSLMLM